MLHTETSELFCVADCTASHSAVTHTSMCFSTFLLNLRVMQVSRLLSSSFRHLSSVSPFHFTRQTHQTWKVPDASQIAYLVRAQPYLSVCIFIQSILVSGSIYFFPLQPPSFPPTPFSPVTKLAVSLSICWFFLQWPCTCSHLLSCWPPLPPSPLLNPPSPPFSPSPSLFAKCDAARRTPGSVSLSVIQSICRQVNFVYSGWPRPLFFFKER